MSGSADPVHIVAAGQTVGIEICRMFSGRHQSVDKCSHMAAGNVEHLYSDMGRLGQGIANPGRWIEVKASPYRIYGDSYFKEQDWQSFSARSFDQCHAPRLYESARAQAVNVYSAGNIRGIPGDFIASGLLYLIYHYSNQSARYVEDLKSDQAFVRYFVLEYRLRIERIWVILEKTILFRSWRCFPFLFQPDR